VIVIGRIIEKVIAIKDLLKIES